MKLIEVVASASIFIIALTYSLALAERTLPGPSETAQPDEQIDFANRTEFERKRLQAYWSNLKLPAGELCSDYFPEKLKEEAYKINAYNNSAISMTVETLLWEDGSPAGVSVEWRANGKQGPLIRRRIYTGAGLGLC